MRKASIQDTFLIVILGFSLVMGGLFSIKIMRELNDSFQDSNLSDEAKTVTGTVAERLPKWVDGAFLLLWVMLTIVGLILAMQIQSSPVFFPISIIYFLVLIFISRVFATVYTQLAASNILSTEAGLLTIIPYILPRMHIFSFIIGVMIIGVMVIKR